MKIRLVCVGKQSNAALRELALDYTKRLERLCDLEVVELKDASDPDGAKRLEKEAERIEAAAQPLADCVLWDETGEAMGSVEFSGFLTRQENASVKRLTFIIGSSHGIAPSLKNRVKRKFQLSRMTLTHEWARTLVLEQLYRAFCIKKGIPYHH